METGPWGELAISVGALVAGLWGFVRGAFVLLAIDKERIKSRAMLGTILVLGLTASQGMLKGGFLSALQGHGWASHALAALVGLVAIGVAIGGELAVQAIGNRGKDSNLPQ